MMENRLELPLAKEGCVEGSLGDARQGKMAGLGSPVPESRVLGLSAQLHHAGVSLPGRMG